MRNYITNKFLWGKQPLKNLITSVKSMLLSGKQSHSRLNELWNAGKINAKIPIIISL